MEWPILVDSHSKAQMVKAPNEYLSRCSRQLIEITDIRVSRDHAWKAISTRRHQVLRVYVADTDASDLLFIASVTMGLRNGKQVEGEFAGRLLIADATGSNPRLRLYQVWGVCNSSWKKKDNELGSLTLKQDSSALMKALQP